MQGSDRADRWTMQRAGSGCYLCPTGLAKNADIAPIATLSHERCATGEHVPTLALVDRAALPRRLPMGATCMGRIAPARHERTAGHADRCGSRKCGGADPRSARGEDRADVVNASAATRGRCLTPNPAAHRAGPVPAHPCRCVPPRLRPSALGGSRGQHLLHVTAAVLRSRWPDFRPLLEG